MLESLFNKVAGFRLNDQRNSLSPSLPKNKSARNITNKNGSRIDLMEHHRVHSGDH